MFEQPLQAGSIPHGLVQIKLSSMFNQPLMSGILPTTLRELVIGKWFSQPSQPAACPMVWRYWPSSSGPRSNSLCSLASYLPV